MAPRKKFVNSLGSRVAFGNLEIAASVTKGVLITVVTSRAAVYPNEQLGDCEEEEAADWSNVRKHGQVSKRLGASVACQVF